MQLFSSIYIYIYIYIYIFASFLLIIHVFPRHLYRRGHRSTFLSSSNIRDLRFPRMRLRFRGALSRRAGQACGNGAQFVAKTETTRARKFAEGRSPCLVSQINGSIYLALMKFRGHRHGAFKRSCRPSTIQIPKSTAGDDNSEMADSRVNLCAIRSLARALKLQLTRTAEFKVDKPRCTRRSAVFAEFHPL